MRTKLTALALAFVLAPAMAYAGPISAIVVFGDSLSDSGNVYAATGNTVPPPPYYQGRFSNGPVAVELLASQLGLTAAPWLLGGTNFAVGGARTGAGSPVPGLLDQVGLFATVNGGVADPDVLYFILAGQNDVRDAASNPSQPEAIVQAAVVNVFTALDLLYGMGARSFFVPNLPNIGRTPEAIGLGLATTATALSILFNQQLATGLDTFQVARPGAVVYRFDTFMLLESVMANPAAYGFTNTVDACLATPVCNPDDFVFWDAIHPTAKTHALFGDAMASTAIPEPASLLLLGTGLIGAVRAVRKRRW